MWKNKCYPKKIPLSRIIEAWFWLQKAYLRTISGLLHSLKHLRRAAAQHIEDEDRSFPAEPGEIRSLEHGDVVDVPRGHIEEIGNRPETAAGAMFGLRLRGGAAKSAAAL